MSIFLLCIIIIFLIALRLLLPYLADFKPVLEQKLSGTIHQRVSIAEMRAYWNGWTPWIELSDVKTENSKDTIKTIKAKLSLFKSLLKREAMINKIEIEGGKLVIQQLPDKSFMVNQIKIPSFSATSSSVVLVNLKNIDALFFNENMSIQLHHLNMTMGRKISNMHATQVVVLSKDWLVKPLVFDELSADFQWLSHALHIHSIKLKNYFLAAEGKLDIHLNNTQPQFKGLLNYNVFSLEPLIGYFYTSSRFHFSGNKMNGQIILNGPLPETLSGNILLHDINILDKDKIVLHKINGEILFAYPNIQSKDLTAVLLKEPVNIQFQNHEVDVNGKLNIAELAQLNEFKFLKNIVAGRTDFRLKGHLKNQEITFDSDLRGVNVLLPKPFKKSESDVLPLHIYANLKNPQFILDATYFNKVSMHLIAEKINNEWDVSSADIFFGGIPASSQNKKGIYLHGIIPEFNVMDWQDYFLSSAHSNKNFMIEMNLNFGKLSLAEIPFNHTNLKVNTLKDNWFLSLQGPSVNADLWIPKDADTKPLKLVVKKVHLSSQNLKTLTEASATKFKMNSNQIPSLDLYFQKFYYDNDDVGAIHLIATKINNGLIIKKMTLKSPNINFIMKGSWLGNQSVLCGHITTTNFGDFLKDWNITNSLEGSEGTLDFNLKWMGPIYAVNLPKLNGHLTMSLSNGVILDIIDSNMEMVGKILNIFSVDSLEFLLSKPFGVIAPKRKGFDFEVEKADFMIQNGNLITKDFYLNGRLAEVDANGRIGLVTHDYDLNVSMTPLLTAFLPMNLALAGGPIIYGFVWLADKLMSGILNGFFRQDYHVTGTWRHPIYQKIKD